MQRVVITGASRGIGRALCEEFVARGTDVVALVRSQGSATLGCVEVVGDLRDTATPELLLDAAAVRGPVDGWINNAGILSPIERLAEAAIDEVIDSLTVNLLAVVRSSALFAAHVAQRPGSGVLLNVSSGAANSVHVGWSHYSAAKAAVDQLTRTLDHEGQDSGLRALSVAPGVVDTGMQAQIRATSIDSFPSRPRFDAMYAAGELRDPAAVAIELADLVEEPGEGPVVRRLSANTTR